MMSVVFFRQPPGEGQLVKEKKVSFQYTQKNCLPLVAGLFLLFQACSPASGPHPSSWKPAENEESTISDEDSSGKRGASGDERRHNHLILELDADGLRVKDARRIDLPLPRKPFRGAWRVVVEGEKGEKLFETRISAPHLVRGEFADQDGRIEGVRTSLDKAVFALRLPVLPDASRLRIYSGPSSVPPFFANIPPEPKVPEEPLLPGSHSLSRQQAPEEVEIASVETGSLLK